MNADFILLSEVTSQNYIVAIVGYGIVFASLVLLYLLFSYMPKLIYLKIGKKKKKVGEEVKNLDEITIQGETTAAISMALHLYFSELHDEESGVLTIKKVSKSYSPWSSKIYAVRNQFNRI